MKDANCVDCRVYNFKRLKKVCMELLSTNCEDGKDCRKLCLQKDEIIAVKAPTCTRCGKNPATLRKSNGQVVNGMCASCTGQMRNPKRHPKPTDTKVKAESPEAIPVTKAECLIMVDFSEYPELLSTLKKIAKEECRTPDLQILSILKGKAA